MMRSVITMTTLLVFLAGSAAFAQRRPAKGHDKQPAVRVVSSHAGPQKTHAPKGRATRNPRSSIRPTTRATTVTVITHNTPTTRSAHNPKLAARLQPLLPRGMDVNNAAQGFRNWGQFVAAVHVSHNLGIPFADLKAKMTGTNPMSLGQAIQMLRPTTTTTRTEIRRAEWEAAEDFRRARDDRD